jgi:hypothetical protein
MRLRWFRSSPSVDLAMVEEAHLCAVRSRRRCWEIEGLMQRIRTAVGRSDDEEALRLCSLVEHLAEANESDARRAEEIREHYGRVLERLS